GGWLFHQGMQDFAGSTVVHYQGALAGLAGAILLGPRIGKFGPDKKPNAIPGHNMAYVTLGVIILWFGWFGFNPGSTLSVQFGGVGFFAYVALNTNLAAAAGVPAGGTFTFTAPYVGVWLMKVTVGIRTEPEVESAGLDVSEHGMWGYPEFYIPVPGGYGTEGPHVGGHATPGPATAAVAMHAM